MYVFIKKDFHVLEVIICPKSVIQKLFLNAKPH